MNFKAKSDAPGARDEGQLRRGDTGNIGNDIGRDFALAVLPTLTILIVLAGVELLVKQRLLFASLASSAFGIYLAPGHKSNRVTVLIGTQCGAALAGFGAQQLWGAGYGAAAGALIVVIAAMVALDAVHPPAVSSALSFAFVPVAAKSLLFFALAVALVGLLSILIPGAEAWWQHRANARQAAARQRNSG